VLKHVSLEVTDVARSEWFYDRFLGRLGFRRFVRDAGYLGYTDGTVTVWFVAARTPRVHRKPPTGDEEVVADHLAFEVGSADAVRAFEQELAKSDLVPYFRGEERPEFRPGYFSAIWTDPDQVVLEVYAVGPRPRARPSTKPRPKSRGRRKS